jgi:hypothetical protein
VEHQSDQSNASEISRSGFATNEAEAIKEAAKEFKVGEALQDWIVARREDY